MKRFLVFDEPVEILISSEETGGSSTTFTQVSPPGGGPPPHSHLNEDESFYVLQGEYEFFLNGDRRRLTAGAAIHASRGSIHTFRNIGATEGKLLVVTVPGGFEKYLEKISPLSIPQDMEPLIEISTRYGISFVI